MKTGIAQPFSVVLTLFGSLFLFGCDGNRGEDEVIYGTYEEESEKTAFVYDSLEQIMKNFPDMSRLKPKKNDAPPGWMTDISWSTLVALVGKPESKDSKEAAEITAAVDGGRIQRLSPRGEKPQSYSASTFKAAREDYAKRSHIAVLRATKGKLPQSSAGTTFKPGFLEGWVVVFDTKTSKPVCQWPIKVKNSAEVNYSFGVNEGASGRASSLIYSLKKDLKNRLKTAVLQAKEEMFGKKYWEKSP